MYNILRFVLGPVIKFLWLGKVSGRGNIPNEGSFIVVANHTSYLDFFLLPVVIPRRIYFLAAEVFFKKKLWMPLVKLTGQIRVDRNSKDKSSVYIGVDEVVSRGDILGAFPEGTRSRDGKTHKGYNGVVRFANKYNVPILPIGIESAFEALPPNKKFPKFIKCNINIGTPFYVNSQNYDLETRDLMLKLSDLSNNEYEE